MKTPYNEIVNIASIGSQTNPISLNEILRKANDEQLTPAAQNKERVLFLGIDVQQDFMIERSGLPRIENMCLRRNTRVRFMRQEIQYIS